MKSKNELESGGYCANVSFESYLEGYGGVERGS